MARVLTEEQKIRARLRTKKWYAANKEKAVAYRRAYYAQPLNREKRKSYSQAYYQTHKEEHHRGGVIWRKRNPDRVKEIGRRQRMKPGYAEAQREYRKGIPVEKVRDSQRRYYSKTYLSRPTYRLRFVIRARIRELLKGRKSDSTEELLGCSREDYQKYLEAKFLPGMSWKNYGRHGWHIDHIRPLSSFNIDVPEEARQAFHYTNTQPLWADDNIAKSDNY